MPNPLCSQSSVLLFGQSSVHALLPSTVTAQVESLLEDGRITEAQVLLDKAETQVCRVPFSTGLASVLQYLHQCIAFKLFGQTRFQDATQHFVKGATDPRILISYFEELRPALCDETPSPETKQTNAGNMRGEITEVEVYAGVQKYMPSETSVDGIIATNLVRNYSPYLRPQMLPESDGTDNMQCAPTGSVASDVPSLLASFRPALRPVSPGPPSRSPSLPTSSQFHLLPSETSTSHSPSARSPINLLQQPTMTIRPHILARVLEMLNLWGPLIELWRTVGEVDRLINVLAGLVEGTYHDPSVSDPLGQVFAILSSLQQPERMRRSLIRKWGVWFAARDVEGGLSVGSTKAGTRNWEREQEKMDELAVLAELRKTGSAAAKRYLEWLIVGKGRENPNLQSQLVENCVDDLFECLGNDAIAKLWRAKCASYASTSATTAASLSKFPPVQATSLMSDSNSQLPRATNTPLPRPPFLSYFASTTPDSPSKRVRIKALLALQATLFSSEAEGEILAKRVQERIVEGGWEKVLGLEAAVLHSKLSHPSIVLRTLHSLRDHVTAEVYASGGGVYGVINSRIGASAAEGCELADWAKWFAKSMEDRNAAVKRAKSTSLGDQPPSEMLKVLLQVYTEDRDIQQASRLLNSQAQNLDTPDIIPLVPESWPLHSVSSFLVRSLRRSLHAKHEGQVVKAICTGQNLEVLERSYIILQDEGAIIEEAVEDSEDGGSRESFDEKGGLVEKVAMQLDQGDIHAVDVEASGGGG
ncbi:hypothetical protein EDC04DRAFT_2566388 [Pisolithus marmoratus]|nr:hypothetical protein EDC04DRAFT_2566388 [Pisolithus marmoratus]